MSFHRRTELGSYTPHEFYIEMSTEHALVDVTKVRVDPIPAETLSTFIHEYIHYLQNVSTVSGFAGYHATQQLLALFSATLDKTGRSKGSALLDTNNKKRLEEVQTYLDLLEGDPGPEHATLSAIKGVQTTRVALPFGKGEAHLSEVTLTCEVENSLGQHQDERLRLGLCVIEEGLAFECDRIVAGIDGDIVNSNAAPSFPYLVFRALGEHLAPGIERRDLIACGVLALLTNDPAGALIDELRDFGQRRSQGSTREETLAAVKESTKDGREENIQTILKDVRGLKVMHAGRGMASTAMDQVGDLFGALLQRRLKDPLWDMQAFLTSEVDQSALTQLMKSVEPCLVLQRMPDDVNAPDDDDRPEHDLMLAFGEASSAMRKLAKRVVPVLQCQVHYLRAHLRQTGFIASANVEPDMFPCPFYRCCTLALRRDHAATCKTKPWEIRELSKVDTCWYGAAVAGTIGTVKLASESPSPEV